MLEDLVYCFLNNDPTAVANVRDSKAIISIKFGCASLHLALQDKVLFPVDQQGGVFSCATVEMNFRFLCEFYATFHTANIPPLSLFKAGCF